MAPKRVSERTLNRWLRLGLIRGYGKNGRHVTIVGLFGNKRYALLEAV